MVPEGRREFGRLSSRTGIVMKRWLSHLFIAGYLLSLTWGIVAHTFGVGANANPAMYYVVWDMFCGWGSYSNRLEIIAEGESGQYYRLAPAPWGTIKPFGDLDRRHYDSYGIALDKMARNVLVHTEHEPMARIYLVEENWAKKFNVPSRYWQRCFEEPQQKHSYFNVRAILQPDGKLIERRDSWYTKQYGQMIADNPRLRRERELAQPMYAVRRQLPAANSRSESTADNQPPTAAESRSGVPLGN